MKKTSFYFFIFLLSVMLFNNCSDSDEETVVSIELDKKTTKIGVSGGVETVQLTANGGWKIDELPSWITVEPMSGNSSVAITISVEKSDEADGKEFDILFVDNNKDVKNIFKVEQYGKKDYIGTPVLPILDYEKLEVKATTNYTIESKNVFVNPSIKDKIFLGNLISHNADAFPDITTFSGYTFLPLDMFTTAIIGGGISRTYRPSKTEDDKFAKEVIAQDPTQSERTVGGDDNEFFSYKQLNAVGMTNLGVKLDEIVTGASFTNKEMTKKYGLIFSFKHTLFSLSMDVPYAEKFLEEELKESDKVKGVSFVSSIDYGRVALLIVGSDSKTATIRSIIYKVMRDEAMSADELKQIESADICCVYFDNNSEVQTVKGGADAIKAYVRISADKENIYPIDFQLSNFEDHAVGVMKYSFKLPK